MKGELQRQDKRQGQKSRHCCTSQIILVLGEEKRQTSKQGTTYGTTQNAVSLVPTLLNMILQSSRIQGFQEFKTTEQLARNRHDRTPIIEFAAILRRENSRQQKEQTSFLEFEV